MGSADSKLIQCTADGNLQGVRNAIEREVNVDCNCKFEYTPLHLAVERGFADVVRALICAQPNVNAVDKRPPFKENQPLHLAAITGNLQITSILLIFEADISAKNLNGYQPLHFAAERGHIDIVEKLVNAGASISAKTNKGDLAIHLATQNNHLAVVVFLVSVGSDLSAKNWAENQPLHIAAIKGNGQITSILLAAGASPSATNSNGNTPKRVAELYGHNEVSILYERYDVDLASNQKSTSSHNATEQDHLKTQQQLTTSGDSHTKHNRTFSADVQLAIIKEPLHDKTSSLRKHQSSFSVEETLKDLHPPEIKLNEEKTVESAQVTNMSKSSDEKVSSRKNKIHHSVMDTLIDVNLSSNTHNQEKNEHSPQSTRMSISSDKQVSSSKNRSYCSTKDYLREDVDQSKNTYHQEKPEHSPQSTRMSISSDKQVSSSKNRSYCSTKDYLREDVSQLKITFHQENPEQSSLTTSMSISYDKQVSSTKNQRHSYVIDSLRDDTSKSNSSDKQVSSSKNLSHLNGWGKLQDVNPPQNSHHPENYAQAAQITSLLSNSYEKKESRSKYQIHCNVTNDQRDLNSLYNTYQLEKHTLPDQKNSKSDFSDKQEVVSDKTEINSYVEAVLRKDNNPPKNTNHEEKNTQPITEIRTSIFFNKNISRDKNHSHSNARETPKNLNPAKYQHRHETNAQPAQITSMSNSSGKKESLPSVTDTLRQVNPSKNTHHQEEDSQPDQNTSMLNSSDKQSHNKVKDTLRKDINPQKNTHREEKQTLYVPKTSTPKSSDKKLTRWSYHHVGNVRIPEICIYSFDGKCLYEGIGCKRLHSKCTSQWQIMRKSNWFNLRDFHSKQIEDAFADVSKDGVQLGIFDHTKLHESGPIIFRILGNGLWEAEFETMILKKKHSPGISYTIRRLSTQSAAVCKSPKATTYFWYFLDRSKKWVKYGEENSSNNNSISSITSEEIEKHYIADKSTIFNFDHSQVHYALDMEIMQQINLDTYESRPVRRRPAKNLINKTQKIDPPNQDLPFLWTRMKPTEMMILVPLKSPCKEYQDVIMLLHLTLPNKRVVSLKRVQNPFLWRAFKNKQNEMAIKYARDEKINVQKLFHGTREEHVNDICKENFDWRLHGTSTGQRHGRGTYFSNIAAFANKFCVANSSGHYFLLVAEVIIGEITKGNSSMIRPPRNSITNELFDTTVDDIISPKIFVKYDKQEYCPIYVIEYK